MADKEQSIENTIPGGHYIGVDGKPHDAWGRPIGAKAASAPAPTDYASMSKDELHALAEQRSVAVPPTGASGAVKADYVKALEAADKKG